MPDKFMALSPALYAYLVDHRSPANPVLAELAKETDALGPISMMQIAPEQGALMTILTRAIGARSAVEVGTFTGYSALSVALGLPDDGTLLCCDISEEWTSIGRRFWERAGVAHKIELRLGPAVDTLRGLPPERQFDIAFIDADKKNYRAYYEEILRRLRPGGLVLFDNVLWMGRVLEPSPDDEDTRAIQELNDFLASDRRVEVTMLPIADGLTIARKRAPAELG